MSESTFYFLFGVTWLMAMAYALSAHRLMARVRRLKEEGRAADAPDPFTKPLAIFGYLGWLVPAGMPNSAMRSQCAGPGSPASCSSSPCR